MSSQPPGRPQKGPFVARCGPGKLAWCRCLRSARYPYCDGTHRGSEDKPLKIVLEEAGCGFGDVVDVTSYHTPGADIGTFWRVRNEYFTAPYPAWTLIQDIALVSPDLHAEVKVNAVIP